MITRRKPSVYYALFENVYVKVMISLGYRTYKDYADYPANLIMLYLSVIDGERK